MKLAVVINVSPGADALAQAVKTQTLLLDRMGMRLQSVRLAVPRLLSSACLGAVRDNPDILVVAGGPCAARRAGQIAHGNGMPILFLPGLHRADWTQHLWNSLSLEDMVGALAREDLLPVDLDAGSVRGQIFFGGVRCGVLPQFVQLRDSFGEAETLAEGWGVLSRTVGLAGCVLRPGLRIRFDGPVDGRATNIDVTAHGIDARVAHGSTAIGSQTFLCTAWRHKTPLGYVTRMARAMAGADWQRGVEKQCFDCARPIVDGPVARALMLDGDPIAFDGPVEFRYLSHAVKTFAFKPMAQGVTNIPPMGNPV